MTATSWRPLLKLFGTVCLAGYGYFAMMEGMIPAGHRLLPSALALVGTGIISFSVLGDRGAGSLSAVAAQAKAEELSRPRTIRLLRNVSFYVGLVSIGIFLIGANVPDRKYRILICVSSMSLFAITIAVDAVTAIVFRPPPS